MELIGKGMKPSLDFAEGKGTGVRQPRTT